MCVSLDNSFHHPPIIVSAMAGIKTHRKGFVSCRDGYKLPDRKVENLLSLHDQAVSNLLLLSSDSLGPNPSYHRANFILPIHGSVFPKEDEIEGGPIGRYP